MAKRHSICPFKISMDLEQDKGHTKRSVLMLSMSKLDQLPHRNKLVKMMRIRKQKQPRRLQSLNKENLELRQVQYS